MELFDMFDLDDESREQAKRYVPNYEMHLIDARHMSSEEIACYEGDMRAFLTMLQDSYERSELENVVAKHRETWYALSEIKKDCRYRDYIDKVSDEELKEGVNMCATLDYYETKGRNAGIERGQERINKLNELLLETGRIEDLKRAVKDKEYQRELLKEYNL